MGYRKWVQMRAPAACRGREEGPMPLSKKERYFTSGSMEKLTLVGCRPGERACQAREEPGQRPRGEREHGALEELQEGQGSEEEEHAWTW